MKTLIRKWRTLQSETKLIIFLDLIAIICTTISVARILRWL